MQTAEQASKQATEHVNEKRRGGNPNWRPGVSANPRGRESKAQREAKIRAKAEQLAEGLGAKLDRMSGLDQEFLLKAADLLTRRARTGEDAVRLVNTARGLVAAVERRAGRREASSSVQPVLTSLKLHGGP
jgi:hypothetical protein